MKKLLISLKLFVSCKSTINLTLLSLDYSIQFLETSSVTIGLELVFLNLCLTVSENMLFLSFQKIPDFSDVWNLWVKRFHNGSPRSMTDRQRLTGRQTFVLRVIGSSTARIIFSLLGEQWWRERSADGVVTDLRVMQVRGPGTAGGLLDVNFSGLWEVVVDEKLGSWPVRGALLTRGPDSSFAEAHKGFSTEPIHIEDEVKDQADEVEDGGEKWRVRRGSRREIKHTSAWHMDGMTRTNTLSQCRVRHH